MNVAIVDAYSSGAYLARALAARGVRLTHIQSSESITKHFLETYEEEHFDREVSPTRSYEELERQIAGTDWIIAGTETGVLLAETLAARLKLPTNRPELAEARRDKFAMIEAVASAGLNVARHLRSTNVEEILAWAAEVSGYPVVIKPPASAGSDGVRICSDAEEARDAALAIVGKINKLGLTNESVLAESFSSGDEYIVDTVSCAGEVIVCDVCRSVKRLGPTGAPIYERIELLDPGSPQAAKLSDYFLQVIAALGIENGPAHGELIWTTAGPCLVEVAARLSGAHIPEVLSDCVSTSAISAAVSAIVAAQEFSELALSGNRLLRHCSVEFLAVSKPGSVERVPTIEDFGPFQSEAKLVWGVGEGEHLPTTIDLFTAPGFIILKNADRAQLLKDQERLKKTSRRVFANNLSG